MIPIDRIQHLSTAGFTGLLPDQALFYLLFGFRPPLIELRFGQEGRGSDQHRRGSRTSSQNRG
jgi:hypothetical protein